MKKTYLKISTIVCLIAYGGGASLKADSISVSTTQPIQSFDINLQTALSFSKDKAKSSIEEQFKALNEHKAQIEKEFSELIIKDNLIKINSIKIINQISNNIHDIKSYAQVDLTNADQLGDWINDFKRRTDAKNNYNYYNLNTYYALKSIIDSNLYQNGIGNITNIQTKSTWIKDRINSLSSNLANLQNQSNERSEITIEIQSNLKNLQATKDKIAQYDTLIAQITTLAKIQQKAISTIHSEQKTLSSLSNATYNNLSALNFSSNLATNTRLAKMSNPY
ncbi:hypothetical protein, partial [Helicobacter sp. 13S00477-4]|uniref:hypothetical protein n=1 Tax=Helicobacter sp. 13S00477-4 TaxID=1905759 RepID=UPI00117B5767